jgi:uncharacterized protein YegP (UPF0339 family)
MRFEIFRSINDYAFHLLNDENQIIFNSRLYSSVENTVEGIRDFVQVAASRANYELSGKAPDFYFTVGLNGESFGRSINFTGTTTPVVDNLVQTFSATDDYEVVFRETQNRTVQRPIILINENSYNFSLISFSGKPGFDVFQNPEDKLYYFLFNDESGKAFLFSQRYNSANSRDNGIRSVIQNAGNDKRYEIIEANGRFYFILKSINGKEIARSWMLESREEVETAIAYLKATALNFEETYKKAEPVKREKANPADSYKFTVKSKSGIAGFESFENIDDKQQYFHFNNAKGKAILFSQSYENASGRDNGIKSVIKNAYVANRYVRQEEDGKFYFILKAGNNQEIARSPLFTSKKEMEAAIAFLQEQAVTFASKYKVELRSETTQSTETRTFNIHIDRPEEITSVSDRNIDEYDFTQLSKSGKSGFESFQSEKNGKYYFHFNDENGKAILFSESYPNTKVRDNGIKSVVKNAGIEKRWRIVEENGKYYYSLLAGNHQEIARGPLYDNKEKMLLALAFLQASGVESKTEAKEVVSGVIPVVEEEPVAITLPPVIAEEPEITTEEIILEEIPVSFAETDIKPITEEPVKLPPLALDVVNGEISGRAGKINIKSLEGRDKDGNIATYTIVSLPPAEKGVLLLNGKAIVTDQILTPAEARSLQFDPSGKSAGNAVFSYKATDSSGLESNTALFTIPIFNLSPVAKNITHSSVKSDAGTLKIEPLQVAENEGKVEKFIVTALPATNQGTLLFKNTPVLEQQEFIPAEVSDLYFNPAADFSGDVSFQYKVQDDYGLFSNIATYTIPVEKSVSAIIPPVIPVAEISFADTKQKKATLTKNISDELPISMEEPLVTDDSTVTFLPKPEPLPVAQKVALNNAGETKTLVDSTITDGNPGRGLLPWIIGGAAIIALGIGLWWMTRNKDVPTPSVNADTISIKKDVVIQPPAPVTIENFQPISLYFNNDQPDPRSEKSKTILTYGQTYQTYYAAQPQFIKEYGKGLPTAETSKVKTQIVDFFDGKVKKGYEDLLVLSDRLLAKLKDSNKVEITVTGFASPLAASDYNEKLTSRRVSSIENHFLTYKNGQFKSYMDKGLLIITQKASGENTANQSISDDRKDVRNSWYSPSASVERRVEITDVTVQKQK